MYLLELAEVLIFAGFLIFSDINTSFNCLIIDLYLK